MTYRVVVFKVCRKVSRLNPWLQVLYRLTSAARTISNSGYSYCIAVFDVCVAHGLHDGGEIASVLQNPSAIVMPSTVQNQIFRNSFSGPRETMLLSLSDGRMLNAWTGTPSPRALCRTAPSGWRKLDCSLVRASTLPRFYCPAQNPYDFPTQILDACKVLGCMTNQPPFFCLVEHSAQGPQSAVGI